MCVFVKTKKKHDIGTSFIAKKKIKLKMKIYSINRGEKNNFEFYISRDNALRHMSFCSVKVSCANGKRLSVVGPNRRVSAANVTRRCQRSAIVYFGVYFVKCCVTYCVYTGY